MWLVGLESCAMAIPGQTDVECWFLCPPNLSSSFCTPRSEEARPRPAAALLSHSCYQMSGVPSLFHTQQRLCFLVLLSLGTAFLPSTPAHGTTQSNFIVLEPGKEKQGNQINTSPQYTGGDWAEFRQFLCSEHHSKGWALHHLRNPSACKYFQTACKYFQTALLKRRGNPGRVIHRPDVLDQENESRKGQILLL